MADRRTYLHKHFGQEGYGSDRYIALGEPEEAGSRSHPATQPRKAAWVDIARAREIPAGPSHQASTGQMFVHQPARIHGLFAHPEMSTSVPTLLGLAAGRSLRDTGTLPVPDSSLSEHSSKIVQTLRKKGLPIPKNEENPQAQPTNTIRKDRFTLSEADITWTDLHDNYPRPLGKEEVSQGGKTFRALLSGNVNKQQFKKPKPRNQGKQLGLF
jgi:hypothetical protein